MKDRSNRQSARTYEAYVDWSGSLHRGEGQFELGSGASRGDLSPASASFGATPEELLGAAEAASFTMTLAHLLGSDDHPVRALRTRAEVRMGSANGRPARIESVWLFTTGEVADIDAHGFQDYARRASEKGTIARGLQSVALHVESELVDGDPAAPEQDS